MYSVVDLVNMALRQIKVREIISLDDETVEAKSAKQMLKLSLGDLLNRADWRFAKVKRVLPKLDIESIDAAYATEKIMSSNVYLYPEDVVRIREVSSGRCRGAAEYELLSVKLKSRDSFVSVLVSRLPHIELTYTRYCAEVNLWPVTFQRAFVHYFAYNMAMYSALGDAQATQMQLYNMAVKEAMASNTNEDKHRMRMDPEILKARDY